MAAQTRDALSVISVDLAHASYDAVGIVVLTDRTSSFEALPVPAASLGLEGKPDATTLAEALARECLKRGVKTLLLDGPQGWKHPDSELGYRDCENKLNAQFKTCLPGITKPANALPYIEFSIGVFARLVKCGFSLLGSDHSEDAGLAMESYPAAAWAALGVDRPPGRRKASKEDLRAALRRVSAEYPVTVDADLTHDELQALIAGLAGIAFERGNEDGYTATGAGPALVGGTWREGFIVVPTRYCLRPADDRSPRPQRRPRPGRTKATASSVRVGVDLGGTKIDAVAMAPDGAILARRRQPTPRGDYPGTLEAISALVRDLEREAGATARVGVGMPGVISPATGLVKNANSVWLNGRDLARDLAAVLPRPLRFANDANCFALSEATDGAAAGLRCVFGVIVGTGTGGGVVVDGRVLTGPNAIAGEWGHNALPWPRAEAGEVPGPPCYCGLSGCIETYISGPGLARDHAEVTGEGLEPEAIVQRAAAGDAAAEATLCRYEERMARALAAVMNLIDPDAIVLGGGLSQLDRLYARVPLLWDRFTFSDRVTTPLLRPRHGDSSGVRGAAWLWGPDEDD